jgi:hypothetical protein
MSYNGSGVFQINTSGQPVVAGTVITASAFNALTADLATGLTTAITKDGQTATTAQIPFAAGLRSTLTTDSTTSTSGSIITDGGLGVAKAVNIGTTLTVTGAGSIQGLTVGRGAGSVSTNTAVGASALAANTSGASNSANGYQALKSVIGGSDNAAFGTNAMRDTTTGNNNTGVGSSALIQNTTGASNVAVGQTALFANTTASNNTAVGYQAGYVSTGPNNVFLGYQAGVANTSGEQNTFVGRVAGAAITTGGKNSILGSYNGNQGGLDIRTSSNYIVLSDGDGNPRIYHSGTTLYSTLSPSAGSFAVKTAAGGVITYDSSSARYKDNIRNSSYGLEAVMQLRSAMFEYKDSGRTDVGFIAEEVDLVIPELVPKINGVPEAVSYDRMVSVLVKAIQELKAEFDAYKEAHP